MLTDLQIQNLLALPKIIVDRNPRVGYSEENQHSRCDLSLDADADSDAKFRVFIRKHSRFIENFSIGLRYLTDNPAVPIITLVRYNGAHGESSRQPDGHYATPHIHRITATEVASGSGQPQERRREITDRYNTFEQALAVFFADIGVGNYQTHFPEAIQGRLFNGHK